MVIIQNDEISGWGLFPRIKSEIRKVNTPETLSAQLVKEVGTKQQAIS